MSKVSLREPKRLSLKRGERMEWRSITSSQDREGEYTPIFGVTVATYLTRPIAREFCEVSPDPRGRVAVQDFGMNRKISGHLVAQYCLTSHPPYRNECPGVRRDATGVFSA